MRLQLTKLTFTNRETIVDGILLAVSRSAEAVDSVLA